MTEEPYRWLEAIANRRDYVREQLKGGAPIFAASLPDGILLLGVGTGRSKVFELFDRHAMAGLGHPADIENIRQAAIDAAHIEAFTRAPEDVSLRRLVSFGLGPRLKTNFEQIFSAPFLVELLFAEIAATPGDDLLFRLHYDGSFACQNGGVLAAAGNPDSEMDARKWLADRINNKTSPASAAEALLQAWWMIISNKSFTENIPDEAERKAGWRNESKSRVIEIGFLDRNSRRAARYRPIHADDTGLE